VKEDCDPNWRRKLKLTYLIGYIVFGTFMLFGCSSQQNPLVHKGIVYNQTGIEIKEFRVVHLPTHGTLALSGILANDKAEIGISPRVLMGTTAQLSWYQNGVQHSVILDLQTLVLSKGVEQYTLVYTLLPNGRASVGLNTYVDTLF
jgi:uncharacterized protein YcfL